MSCDNIKYLLEVPLFQCFMILILCPICHHLISYVMDFKKDMRVEISVVIQCQPSSLL